MRFIHGHEDSFALNYMYERIERRGVLAQLLPGIEGEQGHIAGLRFGNLAADHSLGLIADHFDQVEDFGFGGCGH